MCQTVGDFRGELSL